jgi:Sigma-70 region 2
VSRWWLFTSGTAVVGPESSLVGEVFSGQFAEAAADGAEQAELARARDGGDAAFTRLVAPLRREPHAHCYRMLGSVHDADDALQEALLRAWRGLARFEGRSSLRTCAWSIMVLTLHGRYIAEITSFLGADHFRPFGLPTSLPCACARTLPQFSCGRRR